MSAYSPSVLPQYYGGDVGGKIADALYRRDAMNRQRDLDAVQTGIGLTPIDPNAAPEHSPLSKLVGAIYTRMTGHANGNDVADATANMARRPVTVGTTPNANAPGTAMDEATVSGSRGYDERDTDGGPLPGAFNAATGGFTPSRGSMAASTMRLPSGQTIDMRFTPFGERMQAAQLSHEYNMSMRQALIDAQLQRTGQTLDARRDIAAAHDQTMAGIADKRLQTMQQIHSTPSGSAMFSATHRGGPGGARAFAEDPAHRETRQNFNTANAQLRDAQGELRTLDASISKPLPLLASPTDSAARRALVAEQPGVQARVNQFRQLTDSLGAATHGDYTVPGHLGAATDAPPNAGTDPSAAEYAAAARALQQAGGASNPRARALYDRIVSAIATKHGH